MPPLITRFCRYRLWLVCLLPVGTAMAASPVVHFGRTTFEPTYQVYGVEYTVTDDLAVLDASGSEVRDQAVVSRARFTRNVMVKMIGGAPAVWNWLSIGTYKTGYFLFKPVDSALMFVLIPAQEVMDSVLEGAAVGGALGAAGGPHAAALGASAGALTHAATEIPVGIVKSALRASIEHPARQSRTIAHTGFDTGLKAADANLYFVAALKSSALQSDGVIPIGFSYKEAEAFAVNYALFISVGAARQLLNDVRDYERGAGEWRGRRVEWDVASVSAALDVLDHFDAVSGLEPVEMAYSIYKEVADLGVGLDHYPPYQKYAAAMQAVWLHYEALRRAYMSGGSAALRDLTGEVRSLRDWVDEFAAVDAELGHLKSAVIPGPHAGEIGSRRADVVLVLDATGSMADDIDQAKRNGAEIVGAVAGATSDYRFGLVTYRDRDDQADHVHTWPFTSNPDDFLASLNSVAVSGGGDGPEDVYDGLMAALRTDGMGAWRDGAAKLVVLMGDAPPKNRPGGPSLNDVEGLALRIDPADIHSIVVANGGTFDRATVEAFSEIARRCRGTVSRSGSAAEFTRVLTATLRTALTPKPKPTTVAPPTAIPSPPLPEPWQAGEAGNAGTATASGTRQRHWGLVAGGLLGLVEFCALALLGWSLRPLSAHSGYVLELGGGTDHARRVVVPTGHMLIGRGARAAVLLDDPEVSSQHAVVAAGPAGLQVWDNGSRNGTFINGATVTEPALLQRGDVLRLGGTDLVVRSRQPWEGRLTAAANKSMAAIAVITLAALGLVLIVGSFGN